MTADVDLFGDTVAAGKKALGTNESNTGGTDEWLTPREVIGALGPFDLDPCSPLPDRRPWPTAARHLDLTDDGLRTEWTGRVWCNPPYATAARWLARMADHNHGTALIFARTETRAWHDHVWARATGVLFIKGRLRFCYPVTGRPGDAASAPSALIAYGEHDAAILAALPWPGHYVRLGGVS
jgi:hypothetical protein